MRHAGVAMAAVVVVPLVASAALAWLMFRRRVGGVYVALITQALALAFSTLLVSEQAYTGGFNGLTDFSTVLGFSLTTRKSSGDSTGSRWPSWRWRFCSSLAAAALDSARILLAIRDGESRIRFLGYNPCRYKVVAFAIGGALAGISGALFTLHVGVISPAMVGVVPSIEMVIWVAVGGRESLAGAIVGTLLVNFGKDWISSAMPNLWLFVMGLLFVIVVTVLPRGLAGGVESAAALRRALAKMRMRKAARAPGDQGNVSSSWQVEACNGGRIEVAP